MLVNEFNNRYNLQFTGINICHDLLCWKVT